MEEWKDVIGYEALFSVSNLGRVIGKRTGRVLSTYVGKNGYETFATKIGGRSGKSVCLRVHRIVADAFLERPSKQLISICSQEHYGKVIVRHIDGIKTNNVPNNLEWGTCQDNSDDYSRSDKKLKDVERISGVNNSKSKLTENDIKFIRDKYKPFDKEYGARPMARLLNVSHAIIVNVAKQVTYKFCHATVHSD